MHLLLFLALAAPPSTAAPAPNSTCAYDSKAVMALDQNAFDQDPRGGWRELARREGCKDEAADLIRKYRERQESRLSLLYWHEGQLRASLGETAGAIALFEKSRQPKDTVGWNAYVDATIAFLKNDRAALVQARERLLSTPKPSGFTPVSQQGTPRKWPMNIDVVNALLSCFGRPYDKAYGDPGCRQRK